MVALDAALGRLAPETQWVVVCGAGAAGMAAAISASRAGEQVCLVESKGHAGGTVTRALIHTLGGIYDDAGEFANDGLVQVLAERLAAASPAVRRRRMGRCWVLNACPLVYRKVVESWIESEPNLIVLYGTRIGSLVRSGERVTEIEISCSLGARRLRTKALVDATGTAQIVRQLDASLVEDEPKRAAGGLISSIRGVAKSALEFPKSLAILRQLRRAAQDGRLPPDCGRAWIDSGVYDDEAYVKLFVPLDGAASLDNGGYAVALAHGLQMQTSTVAFLKGLPEFAEAAVCRTGELGVRDGGRIVGEYCLSVCDVRTARKFDDPACRCYWPIEYWDAESGVSVEHLTEGTSYEIPLRSLKVRGLANVWAAGKCLSADRYAQASARVVGTCWSMGEAVGRAIASQ